MIKNRLIALFLASTMLATTFVPSMQVLAGEVGEAETTEDDKEDDSDDEAVARELEESIKEKKSALDKANKEKKALQSSITDVKKIVSSLQTEKQNLQSYLAELDSNLDDIQAKIAQLKDMITQKESDIEQAENDLTEAQQTQDEQYESMKTRIKFMYEKGNTYYMEMLFSSTSFGDMINKADYIEQLSNYDRSKLQEYTEQCEYVEACKLELEAENEVLQEAKAQVEEEESNLEVLIEDKKDEISAKENDISNKEAAIKEYEDYLAEQSALIKSLEVAVSEEMKRLADMNEEVITYDGGMFAWPAPSYTRISDDYGYRMHPTLGVKQFHNGVDMAAPGGSPILAAYDGNVSAAAYSPTMGNYIILSHGDGIYTIYMHASALYVSPGDYVSKGQKIAAVGTTGRSTGNHLHFSVRKNGEYTSPWNYLGKR